MARAAFKKFVEKISKSPPLAIIAALDRECDLLRRGLPKLPDALLRQAYSIFYFKMFVRAARVGEPLDFIIQLPSEEVEFFHTTTSRLVQAQALPVSALDHFHSTFRVSGKTRQIQIRKDLLKGGEQNSGKLPSPPQERM